MAFFNSRTLPGKLDFSPDAMAALLAYAWPGNVRELKNAVSRASAQQLVPDDSPGSVWKLCTVMGSGTPGTLYLLFQHQQNAIRLGKAGSGRFRPG